MIRYMKRNEALVLPGGSLANNNDKRQVVEVGKHENDSQNMNTEKGAKMPNDISGNVAAIIDHDPS